MMCAGLVASVVVSAFSFDRAPVVGSAEQMDVPEVPAPVAVTVDPKTTAFLVLDISTSNCNATRPACLSSLPAIASLLVNARDAGAPVVYAFSAPVLPEVAPLDTEPSVRSGPDKFFQTDLDTILKNAGVETMIIVGTAANGAVLYTAFEATQRGYTVVVAEDGISSTLDFATYLTRWQLLNQPGGNNPDNKPLEKARVTLSRTNMITFQP
jgi:nicotinamidase-related amidase